MTLRLICSFLLAACLFGQIFQPGASSGSGSSSSSSSDSVPAVSGFTWVNQGTATITQTVANGPALLKIPDNSSLNWRGLFVNAPATPYKVIGKIKTVQNIGANSADTGIYFYDGTKWMGIEILVQTTGMTPRVEKLGNATTDTATVATGNSLGNQTGISAPLWYQLRNDGTTVYFDYSFDGANFINLFSESVGTFITPTKIGFGGLSVTGDSAKYVLNDLLSWTTYTNATL